MEIGCSNAQGAFEEMIARVFSGRNDLFRLGSAHAKKPTKERKNIHRLNGRTDERTNAETHERKKGKDRRANKRKKKRKNKQMRAPTRTTNRPKNERDGDPDTPKACVLLCRSHMGARKALFFLYGSHIGARRVASGDLGRFGALPGRSGDAPGRPRDAPGTARDASGPLPGRLGRLRGGRFGSPFRSGLLEARLERFPNDFRYASGNYDGHLAAQGQCFVRVGRFGRNGPSPPKSIEIRPQNEYRTTPKRAKARAV